MNAPNVSFGFGGTMALGVIALVGGVALYVYTKRKEIVTAVNPLSDQNLAYQGAGALTEALTGGEESTPGGALARLREWWSGDDEKIREMLKGSQPAQPVSLPVPSAYVSANFEPIAPAAPAAPQTREEAEALYLARNPDITSATWNHSAYDHWLQYGRAEGRIWEGP